MLKVDVYTIKGTKTGMFSLPKEFGEKILPTQVGNLELLSQAIRVYEDRSHPGLARVKTRGEVNRTTKKWYRQKGTGGARHGARSAPIFVGGGVAHGPKGVKKSLNLSLKMRRKALAISLSNKVQEKKLVVVSGLEKMTKTKGAGAFVLRLAKILGHNKFTFVIEEENGSARNALGNLKNVRVVSYKDLNAYKVFYGGVMVFGKEIFAKEKPASAEKASARQARK